ncbi:hypothetical protein 7908G4F8_45 [Haloquadratum phage sp.]|jgi:hypothetical protein|nr:hypothetical protein 7908G4F8_45 [Haloquadratum phage sp.]
MTETKTVVTTKEIEMVECSSCGQEIEKKEAHYFKIKYFKYENSKYQRKSSGQTDGWVCKYCVENPISLPMMYRTLGENTGWFELIAAYFLIFLSIFMIAYNLSII